MYKYDIYMSFIHTWFFVLYLYVSVCYITLEIVLIWKNPPNLHL